MAPQAPADASAPLVTDVLIVGAGPSGLMLAVCLARLGVDAIVVDGKDGPTRESRALVVQARSMELYDQLGLVDRVLARRSPATTFIPGAGHRELGRVDLALAGRDVTPHSEITVFEQSANERLLVDALGELGREVRWGHRLERLSIEPGDGSADSAASALATLATGDVSGEGGATVTVRARYCVGADGAHSTVRRELEIPFEGETNAFTFTLADAIGMRGLEPQAINVRFSERHIMLGFGMGGDRARLIGVVRDDDLGPDGEASEEESRGVFRREFGVEYEASAWFTTYRLHHRLAARFRNGPCFLVGDAAHIHSPVGGQGMNTGLQDAHNLACAFADVLVDGMPEARLDRYEAERRPVGKTLVDTTDRLFGLVTSDTRRARLMRSRVVPAVGPVAVRLIPRLLGLPRVFGFVSQTRIRYGLPDVAGATSPACDDGLLGIRLPWTGDNFDALRSMRWQLHGYGVPERAVRRIAGELGVEAHVFGPDPHGRLRRYRVYLVRRDGFIVAEVPSPGTGAALAAARARLAGG
ncbi:2-polyprenyl-6-methoxyphenol hydroxylase-like FAD-dependent oxidoreductase [Agromyces terreus]|uniref:2-polyprenyl-6-methoxyphenol hydroxylase-like FAD-dependent oxidoreductase n=1 Tax=Agromyces terreus TaxID=424795 RepID=A0A9X2KBE3_9MICO|nr:FAD-dependent monooxygenase [Agromyces terreus]MCP2370271.1 2-polyprenyl-6-methoxyphenol hydroxylase-like FAD-dependent oxidoreductase [Agromyces terreus]